MRLIRYSFIFILMLVISGLCSQTGSGTGQHNISVQLPSIALLDIEPGDHTVDLIITSPTEAGNPVTIGAQATDNNLWVNYTSALASTSANRSVSVRLESGTIPQGLNLRVQAAAASGTGAGTFGTPTGIITISGTAQNILTGIGRSYTGNGTGNGHRLTYTLVINNYGQIFGTENENITISYTITQN